MGRPPLKAISPTQRLDDRSASNALHGHTNTFASVLHKRVPLGKCQVILYLSASHNEDAEGFTPAFEGMTDRHFWTDIQLLCTKAVSNVMIASELRWIASLHTVAGHDPQGWNSNVASSTQAWQLAVAAAAMRNSTGTALAQRSRPTRCELQNAIHCLIK